MHLRMHGSQNNRSALLITLPHSYGLGPLTHCSARLAASETHGSCCPHLPQSRGYRCVYGTTSAIYVCAGICTVVLGVAQQVQ